MQFTSARMVEGGVLERELTLGDMPGRLWTPPSAVAAPLILLGHPGGLQQMHSRLAGRARHYATRCGYAAVAIELPGSGDRPLIAELERARADLRTALAAGRPVDDIVDTLVPPLVERAVPEWQATLDALLALPEIGGPVGCDGGPISVAIRLARIDPRISAAVLFAGSFVPRAMFEEAREVVIPLQVLLQWDDRSNDRQMALDLFDALGSREKTLHANLGGHTGVPSFELDDAARFFARHFS